MVTIATINSTPQIASGISVKVIQANDQALKVAVDALEAVVPLVKVSTTTVDFTVGSHGQTTLYTVPTGKTFIPIMAIIRAGADAGDSVVTFGRVGALTDWLGNITLSNLDAAGDHVKVEVINNATPAKGKTYAAAQVFQIDVTTANGGAGNSVDLFGYLV